MATGIYKRGNIWWIRYTGIDGLQKRERSGNKFQDASLLLAQRKNDIRQNKEPEIKSIPNHLFPELTEKYLDWIAGRQASAKVKGYVIGQLKEIFGTLPLKKFNTAIVEQLQTDLINKKYKASSNNKVLNVLKAMFTKAVEWEMVEETVLKRIRKVKPMKDEEKRLRYLSIEECPILISACEPHLQPIVITALNTGMRRGEIFRLKWTNVDLKNGFILLDKTKNGERREIPINNTLKRVLQGLTRRLDIPLVFFNQDTGNPYQDIKRAFATAKKRVETLKCPDCDYRKPRLKTKDEAGSCPKCGAKVAVIKGIEDFHFHDLRHTFASHCIMAGVDITTLSKLLGHKSLKMTLRYAHLAPSHLVKAVNILDKFLNSKKMISTIIAQRFITH